MAEIYKFFSKWTRLDELLAPYNARLFDKLMIERGRMTMRIGAIVAVVMLAVGVALVALVFWVGAQRLYLVTYGVEIQATIVGLSGHTATVPNHRRPTTMTYTYTTPSDGPLTDRINRTPRELIGLKEGGKIPLLYAERWPGVNIPRIGLSDSSLLGFYAMLGCLFCLHLGCFLKRYMGWRGEH